MIEGATVEGQTAHLQAGLCRWCSPRPQIRTARQGSIHSTCFAHARVIEFTCRRSDLWWASSGARPVVETGEHVVRKSKFTEDQIAFALKQAELGISVEEVCRKMGIS